MSDLNNVILIGRLTRDPELRYTQNGTAVASLSIANNNTYVSNGEKVENVSFFNCTAWGKQGETITQYFKKGERIAIQGRLNQRTWEDDEGKKRSQVNIIIEKFMFIEKKDNSNQQQSQPDNSPFSDDDILF